MKTFLCAILLFVLQASAKPFDEEKFENVIGEARSFNNLIADQLEELNFDDQMNFEDQNDLPFYNENEPMASDSTNSEEELNFGDQMNFEDQNDLPFYNENEPMTSDSINSEPIASNITTAQPPIRRNVTTAQPPIRRNVTTAQPPVRRNITTAQPPVRRNVTTAQPPVRRNVTTAQPPIKRNVTTAQPMNATTPEPTKSNFLIELPFLKKASKDLTRFYWSLHTLRNLVGKNRLIFLQQNNYSSRTFPYLLPSSTLIKSAMQQLQMVFDDTQKIAAIADKGGFGDHHDEESYGFKDSLDSQNKRGFVQNRNYRFLLQTEIKISQFYWTLNALIGYLKHLNGTKSTTPEFNGLGTTVKTIEDGEQFLQQFKSIFHKSLTELPSMYCHFQKLKKYVEKKEIASLKKLKIKHRHDK